MNGIDTMIRRDNSFYILQQCFLWVFIVGFLTYAYQFGSSNLSFDALISSDLRLDETHKLSIGRFAQVLNHYVRGFVAAPWIVAVLSLTWYALSLYFIARIFNINSSVRIGIIAGLILTSPFLIHSFLSFQHEMDNFALAFFMTVLASYLLANKPFWGASLVASLCVAMSIGFYPAYISIVPSIFLLRLIKDIFEKVDARVIIKNFALFCFYCILGGVFFISMYKSITFFLELPPSNSYNSWESMINDYGANSIFKFIYEIIFSYYIAAVRLLSPITFNREIVRYINLLFLFIASFCLFRQIIISKLSRTHLFLLFMALVLIVPSIFLARILALGFSHEGTQNGEIMIFIIPLMFCIFYSDSSKDSSSRVDRIAPYIYRAMLITLIMGMFMNWVLANRLFYRKELVATTTHSYFTRILHEIERNPHYFPDTTPVVIIGYTSDSPYLRERTEYEEARNFPFMSPTIIENENDVSLGLYFNYHLGSNIRVKNVTHEDEAPDFSANMPVFPKEGSVKFVGGTMYVKVSDLLSD